MKFGIFYEHQLPRPWHEGDELKLFQDALDQVELADRLGIDHAWEVEHHFLEEYSHSSAPEVFLAACSQRTKNIRLGHGIVLMPPGYNHPARVAERIATLDLVSNGRVEFGTGESSALLELGGYKVPVEKKREMWRETVEQCLNMMVMNPYPGFKGQFFDMPCRNVVPKPVQKPHVPIWVPGDSEATRNLTAELADCWFIYSKPPETIREWAKDMKRRAGRDIPIAVSTVCLAGLPDADVKKWSELYALERKHRFAVPPTPQDVLNENLWGSSKDCIDRIRQWQDAGVTHVVIQPIPPLEGMRHFAKEIMPAFRK